MSAARDHLSVAFSAALAEMNSMPVGVERSRHLRGLATFLVGQPEEFRATAISQCPDLELAEPYPDTLLNPEEDKLVSKLTHSDFEVIDEALLGNLGAFWCKVPRVIGSAIVALDGRFTGLPSGLYVQRIGAMVKSGRLLAKGNIEFIRLSEVRLPAVGERVA